MQKKLNSSTESETIPQQERYKVLLIGESCTDVYEYGICERLSPEAPVPVLKYTKQESMIGMAHNVYSNLESFGIKCDFHTNDPKELIKKRFIDTKSMNQLLRQDIENDIKSCPIKLGVNADHYYDAIVISDYNKGYIDPESIRDVCLTFDGPIFVDSKRRDLSIFPKSIIKINQYEAEHANVTDSTELIVTYGKGGAIYKGKRFDAPHVDVFDVTGAGDVFLASLCYYYLVTRDLYETIPKCIELATKSVQHVGSYILTEDDLR